MQVSSVHRAHPVKAGNEASPAIRKGIRGRTMGPERRARGERDARGVTGKGAAAREGEARRKVMNDRAISWGGRLPNSLTRATLFQNATASRRRGPRSQLPPRTRAVHAGSTGGQTRRKKKKSAFSRVARKSSAMFGGEIDDYVPLSGARARALLFPITCLMLAASREGRE